MFRRFAAILAATVVILALVPALAAQAISASALLTAGAEVFPGTSSFTVRVTNTESMVLGGSMDAVRLLLPSDFSAPKCVSSGSFACTAQDRPGPDLIDLTGAVLTPGQSVDIAFTAAVNAPLSGDRTSTIAVSVSDLTSPDLAKLADLATRVRALDVVLGSLRPTAPAGALDGGATSGQAITYAFDVRNYAQSTQRVTATLASNSGGGSVVVDIPAFQSVTASFPVTLRDIGGLAGVVDTFSAAATAASATATTRTGQFTIEHAPALSLLPNTFSNPFVRTNAPLTYDLSIEADKIFPPGVNVLSGSLSFAGQQTALTRPSGLARNGFRVRLDYAPLVITAPDGPHNVTFSFAGTDDNGFPWTFSQTLNGLITIDNIGPVVTLNPLAVGGKPQARNGDTVTVSGTVNDGSPLDFVRIVSADGQSTVVQVTRNGSNFSGTATLAGLPAYTTVRAEAQASDRAGNAGIGASPSLDIDNVLPALADPGRVISGTSYGQTRPVVEVTFTERYLVAGACAPTHWKVAGATVSEVRYSDNTPCQRGKAGPDNTRILVVLQALDPDADGSGSYTAAPTGVSSVDDPARDGALNTALTGTFNLVSGIAPALPDLGVLTRNAGAESLPQRSDGAYHTRFKGDDTRVTVRNSRAGYVVQILDGNNAVLANHSVSGANAVVTLPIGNTDGSYIRRIRLINTSGLVGPTVELQLVLDRVAPLIGGSARNGDGRVVTASTNEPLVGSLNPNDWFVAERDNTPGNNFHFYGVDRITGVGTSLTLDTQLGDNGPFAGVVYEFFGSAAGRPEDWAGNSLGDRLSP